MSYREYIIKKYLEKMSPAGDLARDIRADPEFPVVTGTDPDSDRQTIKTYLSSRGACSGCMNAFRYTWSRYRRSIKRKETKYDEKNTESLLCNG